MERMALIVEGQTERIFVEKLIREMAGRRSVHIDSVRAYGGGEGKPRIFEEIKAERLEPSNQFYIIIYESMNDDRVVSDVRDLYPTLTQQFFDPIIAIRDVHPRSHAEIPGMREDFVEFTPSSPVVPELILEIREIEAWFLGEHTHFLRMDPDLTPDKVTSILGYDPSAHDVTSVDCPCDELRKVYNIVGLGYNKSRRHCERTVDQISYEEIYLNLGNRISDLGRLINLIDEFFGRTS